MVWGKGEELTKEKIQELIGLDPTKLEERLTQMGQSITEFNAMKDQISGIKDIKDSLARLEGRLPKIEEPATKTPEFISVLEDEEGAFNQRLDARLGPLAEITINTRAEMAYNTFRSSKPDFAAFEKSIRERWDALPAKDKVNANQLVQNLYYMFKGMKVDGDGNTVTFVEPANSGGGNGTGVLLNRDNTNKTGDLTPEEKARAAKWGVSEDQFKKTKESMTFVGG